MSKKDVYHDNVREALEKEGWTINNAPLRVYFPEVDIATATENDYMESESGFTAKKGETEIAVEVESFIRRSFLLTFHQTIGQYSNYRSALSKTQPDRTIYLAIPDIAYVNEFFHDDFTKRRFVQEQVNLIVFDTNENKIIEWKNYKNTSKL